MVDGARHHEQQIGQPVDIPHQDRVDRRLEHHHAALRAAADGPRQVQPRTGRDAARKNKRRERRQIGFEPIDELLEALDIGVAKRRLRDTGGDLFARDRRAGRRAQTDRAGSGRARRRCCGDVDGVEARAKPSQALSSSTSPYASTRASLFETRVPPKSDVSPVSPVRV